MRQPKTSNEAQQNAPLPDLGKPGRDADAIGPRLKPSGDGAVRGGERTKPGQMTGDQDVAPTAPPAEVEKAVRGGQGKTG